MTPTQGSEGLSNEQLLQMIEEIRQGKQGEHKQDAQVTPPAPQKLEVKIGDKTFSGSNEEIQRDIAAYQEQLVRDAQAQALRQQAEENQNRQRTQERGYDKNEIKKMLASKIEDDPVEAWREMNKYVFGVPDVGAVLQQMAMMVAQQNVEITAMKFVNEVEDWPGGEKNYETLNRIMVENQIPPTLHGMKAAYALGKVNNRFEFPKEDEQEQATPAPVRAAAPPVVRRDGVSDEGAQRPEDLEAVFDGMSLDELKALASKLPKKRVVY